MGAKKKGGYGGKGNCNTKGIGNRVGELQPKGEGRKKKREKGDSENFGSGGFKKKLGCFAGAL